MAITPLTRIADLERLGAVRIFRIWSDYVLWSGWTLDGQFILAQEEFDSDKDPPKACHFWEVTMLSAPTIFKHWTVPQDIQRMVKRALRRRRIIQLPGPKSPLVINQLLGFQLPVLPVVQLPFASRKSDIIHWLKMAARSYVDCPIQFHLVAVAPAARAASE